MELAVILVIVLVLQPTPEQGSYTITQIFGFLLLFLMLLRPILPGNRVSVKIKLLWTMLRTQ